MKRIVVQHGFEGDVVNRRVPPLIAPQRVLRSIRTFRLYAASRANC